MSITKKLLKQYTPKTQYFILPNDEWQQYLLELFDIMPAYKREIENYGFPMVSYHTNFLHRHLRRGMRCLTYRGIPVFEESNRKKVLKRFSL